MRGAVGFHRNGFDKLMYNRWGSDPQFLGKRVLEFVRDTSDQEMEEIYDRIILVAEEDEPCRHHKWVDITRKATREEREEIAAVINNLEQEEPVEAPEHRLFTALTDTDNKYTIYPEYEYRWYDLLRPAMGNLNVYKAGLRYMLDSDNYPASEECEYAYVVNLDTKKVEIYVGLSEEERRERKPNRRRYSEKDDYRDSWKVSLELEIPFEDVRTQFEDSVAKMLALQPYIW